MNNSDSVKLIPLKKNTLKNFLVSNNLAYRNMSKEL